jgi:hypothetical protein
VVVELCMLVEGVHRDRHDVGGRRLLEQRAYGMQGGFRVRWRERWRNEDANKDLCAVSRVDLRSWVSRVVVRLAQLIGEKMQLQSECRESEKFIAKCCVNAEPGKCRLYD